MKRRRFVKLAGGACASALLGGRLPEVRGQARADGNNRPDAEQPVLLDRRALESRNQNRSTVVGRHGMVCTSQPLASMAGLDVLKAGGNAIDAAVCANAMLSLVEPMMCGPGGDLFAIVWSQPRRKLFGLNASGRAPYDWSLGDAEKLGLKSIDPHSPLSWNVPGCVSGWDALLKRFGTLGLDTLLKAPIAYALEGFPVTPVIAGSWSIDPQKDRTLAATFLPDGKPARFGDVFKNPDLAGFFELIARGGAEAFYHGEIAERIVRFSQGQGGRFSMRDFREHRADWVEPVTASYRGYDVWELPPNGQGIAALQILNMLEQFDVGSLRPNSAEHLHLFIEAKKLAFEDRAVYYADMDFADVPLGQLISKEYARQRAKQIDPKRAARQVAPGRLRSSADTVYLTAADAQGNMVSLIQSVYWGWGSRHVPDRLGFPLQNRGVLFSLDPQARNRLQPHKRPFHTIIPAFVTQAGRPVFSFGVMGGDVQPQGHAQVLMNLIDFGMSVQQAGEQPRAVHFESSTPTGGKMADGGSVGLERHIPDAVRDRLAQMGHKIRRGVGAYGGYQGIWREEDPMRYFGGSDPRKDGCAVGY
ncbi:MAG: gamma-glutamyltransferase family protein [Pirellulales bacterium]|nr:gamma-glutamyltransferase family protein [Pirellulales bacterium]